LGRAPNARVGRDGLGAGVGGIALLQRLALVLRSTSLVLPLGLAGIAGFAVLEGMDVRGRMIWLVYLFCVCTCHT
jgi:hypothetical protein